MTIDCQGTNLPLSQQSSIDISWPNKIKIEKELEVKAWKERLKMKQDFWKAFGLPLHYLEVIDQQLLSLHLVQFLFSEFLFYIQMFFMLRIFQLLWPSRATITSLFHGFLRLLSLSSYRRSKRAKDTRLKEKWCNGKVQRKRPKTGEESW